MHQRVLYLISNQMASASRMNFGGCGWSDYISRPLKDDELLKGDIDHPIRFTLSSSNINQIYLARHKVNSSGGQYSLPMGARIRLKNSVDISPILQVQIILKAMKTMD